MSSGATRLTKGKGGLGLEASDSRQGRYDVQYILRRSRVGNKYKYVDLYTQEETC